MADQVKGVITGFKIGRVEFAVSSGSTIGDVLREQGIEFENGTTYVNGVPIPTRDIGKMPAPEGAAIHHARAAKGGLN
jgi:hypothetical protein